MIGKLLAVFCFAHCQLALVLPCVPGSLIIGAGRWMFRQEELEKEFHYFFMLLILSYSILLSVVTFLDLVDLTSVSLEWSPEKTKHEG